jgi:hypothetical protein
LLHYIYRVSGYPVEQLLNLQTGAELGQQPKFALAGQQTKPTGQHPTPLPSTPGGQIVCPGQMTGIFGLVLCVFLLPLILLASATSENALIPTRAARPPKRAAPMYFSAWPRARGPSTSSIAKSSKECGSTPCSRLGNFFEMHVFGCQLPSLYSEVTLILTTIDR